MKVALRRNKGILEFLGFVDGKGRIRKAKVRKANPSGYTVGVSEYNSYPAKTWGGAARRAKAMAKRFHYDVHVYFNGERKATFKYHPTKRAR